MIFNRVILFITIFFSFNFFAISQKSQALTRKSYIDSYKELAIKEMRRSGIPASITLAQGMLESDNGNSTLATKANNHFGIKCHNTWNGQVIYQDDDRQGECFRKYKSVYESYQDHSDFLMSGSRYSFLFELETADYKGWARGLKKAGYATSSSYSEMLIKIIEENELQQYDQKRAVTKKIQSGGKVSPTDSAIPSGNTKLMYRNRVKYIIVKPDDTFRSIQEQYDLLPYEIYKYNDMERDEELKTGQVIYLQPKRNKAEVGKDFHTVKEGETMKQISQIYAVKLENLYEKNLMLPGTQLKSGDKISLRKQLHGAKPVVAREKRAKPEDEQDDSELRFEFDK